MKTRLSRPIALLTLVPALLLLAGSQATATSGTDWTSYLNGPAHSSFAPAEQAITTANAPLLHTAWTWKADPPTQPGQPANKLFASPTVYAGHIYIGAATGDFYSLTEATGTVDWKRSFGFTTGTCKARGITSTAAVDLDPVTGNPTVYVGAPDGYLYALDAVTGNVQWSAFVVAPGTDQNEGYIWGSPTIFNGEVFIGMASNCDTALIRGGVKAFDLATGNLIGTYYTVPEGALGGSVWTSLAARVAGSSTWAFATTGNADFGSGAEQGDSFSIVRLDGATMTRQDIWTVPGLATTDKDFGASPVLFHGTVNGTSTRLVGACNKVGKFYALRQSHLAAGPVWKRHIGSVCLAAAIWDSAQSRLFIASDATTVNGQAVEGAVRQLNPSTGATIWETALPGQVFGTASLDGAGVLAISLYQVADHSGNGTYLVDASNGAILAALPTGGAGFSQPVFANGYLFVASVGGRLTAFAPPG